MNEQAHVEAFKELLDSLAAPVFEWDQVAGTREGDEPSGALPENYVLLTVERRYNPTGRNGRPTSTTGWRLVLRFVGEFAENARVLSSAADDLLSGEVVEIDGRSTTPLEFETGESPEPDGAGHSGFASYTYAY